MSPPASMDYQYPEAYSRNFVDGVNNQAKGLRSDEKGGILHHEYSEAPVSAQPTEQTNTLDEVFSISGDPRSDNKTAKIFERSPRSHSNLERPSAEIEIQ